MGRKIKVFLLHRGLWDMEKLSMPLALGYLKASALAEEELRRELDLRIFSYGGGDSVAKMLPDLLFRETPDILGFSVFGWNFRQFGRIAETFRQVNPTGWCIFGGPHASCQGERVFRTFPAVDIVVNGEGERAFVSLLRAYLRRSLRHELHEVPGISFRDERGAVVTTTPEERLEDLDVIPSPFLTGAMPILGPNGDFLYDVAMMETTRGCPYHCSFCTWGGAVGQTISRFSRERLRAELEFFGRLKVENIALCDSNYGMFRQDVDFLDDLVATRAKYGYPRSMVNSWAKNKTASFYRIVSSMQEAGLAADFTLALQTLAPDAIVSSNRSNMSLNQFEGLCEWLNDRGLPSYVELIWGLPGETEQSFLDGYDRVARYTSRIATYTNVLLPNSDYDRRRRQHELVTVRGEDSDFECILAHSTMSFSDNHRMHGFLFLARTLAEHMYLRHVWAPLRALAGLTQSQAIRNFDAWLSRRTDAAALALRACQREVVEHLDAGRIGRGLRCLYRQPGMHDLFTRWWEEAILPLAPAEVVEFLRELLAFDLLTQPAHAESAKARGLWLCELGGEAYYARSGARQVYDVAAASREMLRAGGPVDVARYRLGEERQQTYYYKTGFEVVIDNHETVLQYVAKTLDELQGELGHGAEPSRRFVVPAGHLPMPCDARRAAATNVASGART